MSLRKDQVTDKHRAILKKVGIQKGEVRNPLGNSGFSNPVIKALRKLTLPLYREVIELALTSNIAQLQKLAADPDTPAIQVGVAIALMKAIKVGDWDILEKIASRIVGKIPDEVNVNSNNSTKLSVVDERKVAEVLKKLELDV